MLHSVFVIKYIAVILKLDPTSMTLVADILAGLGISVLNAYRSRNPWWYVIPCKSVSADG